MTKPSGYATAAPAAMMPMLAALVSTTLALAALGGALAWGESPAADDGLRVFKSANCVGCHKWTGEGGGGYGAAAANLRRTSLDLQQIEQTIRCGRPSTGMPYFDRDAYTDGRCYGLKRSDMTQATMPPAGDHWLRSADVDAVAKYVVTHLKGQGEPNLAQCQAFFGTQTRACDAYRKDGGGAVAQAASAPADTPSSGTPSSETGHGHLKIEAAPDANTRK